MRQGNFWGFQKKGSEPTNTDGKTAWLDFRVNIGTDEEPIYEGQELPFNRTDGNIYYWDSDNEFFVDSDGNEVVSEG
jgi:hypothetical protein